MLSPERKAFFETLHGDTMPSKRRYQEFVFNGNEAENKAKILELHKSAQGFNFKNMKPEKERGIHISFVEGATYGDFVSVLDVLFQENVVSYHIINNHIWVFQH